MSTDLFLNREIAFLEFNARVLDLAESEYIPLLERLKFLCIVSSNMDEFFEVRVSWLKELATVGSAHAEADGLSVRHVLEGLSQRSHALVAKQYRLLREMFFPELADQGIHFLRRSLWNDAQQEWVRAYFDREVMPVLTPIGLDPAHPFPRIINKSLNFIVELEGRDAFGRSSRMAVVQAPRVLPRAIALPPEVAGVPNGFVFLSSVMHAHVNTLFPGMQVNGCYQFRVTRNSDLSVDEDEITDLRRALEGELSHRQFGDAARLELADNCPVRVQEFLLHEFGLDKDDLYRVDGPVNLVRLMNVPDLVDRPDLKYPPHRPSIPPQLLNQTNIFNVLKKGDVLLHHPFQSFAPVIEFVQQAARDPNVIAIKMTVYRTGAQSALMEALIEAAAAGKEVTAVVELKARFDEAANINWAGRLEDIGAHVVYGVVGHKTHAKMLLVVRREPGGLRRYAHLGTGNYHPRTANFYTDFGLLTAHEGITEDVHQVFMQLTSLGKAGTLKHLWQAPFTLHEQVMRSINNEAEIARAGRPASIVAKMNSLIEPLVIQALYEASQAGVKITLIVRGMCVLRPGVPGLSDNIEVRSIVGRFLEHSRIFYFLNDKQEDLYLASADWMGRNFFRRIEVAFPILDPKLKKRVLREGIKPYLADNTQAWVMQADGSYRHRTPRGAKPRAAQEWLIGELGAK